MSRMVSIESHAGCADKGILVSAEGFEASAVRNILGWLLWGSFEECTTSLNLVCDVESESLDAASAQILDASDAEMEEG